MLIFLLLVAVPIIEIALFIEVGGWLGLWPTIGIVILTAAIGTVLLRAQGLATLSELQRRLATGEDPSATLAHGAMILVAGVPTTPWPCEKSLRQLAPKPNRSRKAGAPNDIS